MKGLMKILGLLILLWSFTTAYGQKVYNIAGMKEQYTAPGSEEGKLYPLKFKIFITDSTFSSDGLKYKYTITKKVDSSYFKMTDGIKEFVVHVGEAAGINKYMKKQNISAYITVEGENTITSYYY